MPQLEMTAEHARVVEGILDDTVLRLDALAGRGDYLEGAVLCTAIATLSLWALRRGKCRSELLGYLEEALADRCPCEVETRGNA